jgi:hypothetical protein
MAQPILRDSLLTTFTTSIFSPTHTSDSYNQNDVSWEIGREDPWQQPGWSEQKPLEPWDLGSTGKGILIGMLSAFGTAALVALVVAAFYFFRFTSSGRILLDRFSRPGEFDDEQQFLREEEEALAEMDDLQKAEYLRAKGQYCANVCHESS